MDLEYTIHEIPIEINVESVDNFEPKSDEPDQIFPQPENPDPARPVSENDTQLRTNHQEFNNQNIHEWVIDRATSILEHMAADLCFF